jgi:predicted nucleic acid-binding protein
MADGPAVFADANVLYSAALRDILIELAVARVIRLHWSEAVLDELDKAILSARPTTSKVRLASRRTAMNAALPDANVVPAPGRALMAKLPDPNDQHVLAAALDGGCTTLLTFNLRDFPPEQLALEEADIAAVHPDAFLLTLLTTTAAPVIKVIEEVREPAHRAADAVE